MDDALEAGGSTVKPSIREYHRSLAPK